MVTNPFSAMRDAGFSYGVGFVSCLKEGLNIICHSSLDWVIAQQDSEYHSRPLVEQNETVKVKVLNEKLSFKNK